MNKIEKLVYDRLKRNQKLKNTVRNIYQSLFDFLPKKKIHVELPYKTYTGYFFGFHDLNPFNKKNNIHLAYKPECDHKFPSSKDKLNVGYIDLSDGSFNKIGESYTWNFHKGCRLQWVDNENVIYNESFKNGIFYSNLINIKTLKNKRFPFAIDAISPDGKYASSFCYTRLEKLMPGYGYTQDITNIDLKNSLPDNTGIFLADLNTSNLKLLFSIQDLHQYIDNPKSQTYKYFITHSLFSPSSSYLGFMLRCSDPRNTSDRFTRIFAYNIKEQKLFLIKTDNMVSHYNWIGDQMIIYCRIDNLDAHYIINVENSTSPIIIDIDLLNSDGHQSTSENGYITIDTYPNARRIQKLFLKRSIHDKAELIGSFFHPKKFQSTRKKGHIAVDLHPRLSSDGKLISIDTAYNGRRSICIIKT